MASLNAPLLILASYIVIATATTVCTAKGRPGKDGEGGHSNATSCNVEQLSSASLKNVPSKAAVE